MRRVHENQLLMARGEIHLHFEYAQFVPRIFVQPDLSDAENIRAIQKFRDQRDDFLRELHVLRFLGIDA